MVIRNTSKFTIQVAIFFVFQSILFLSCQPKENRIRPTGVSIHHKYPHYTLYKNGDPFIVKGAGGISNFKLLNACGGNTMRVWDTTNLQIILDSAAANQISIIAGLPFINSDVKNFYAHPDSVIRQHKSFESIVTKYRNHPALLMWCVGNELDFPHKLSYNHFYGAFNGITDMIHRIDPDHPVTTSLLNFNAKYIFNLELKCDVDIISFNIYGRLPLLKKQLQKISWLWSGPYMVLEWGINGPWPGKSQTAWGAFIEDTSTKKAEIYHSRYEHHMPTEDPRFLGATVFFWGSKQETTHTWFSMFDQFGAPTESIKSMAKIWGSNENLGHFPQIKYMLLNQKGARDNILLNPHSTAEADLLLNEPFGDHIQKIDWQIFREDWYIGNNIKLIAKTAPLYIIPASARALKVQLTTPSEEGAYRLFATIHDKSGNIATCNTPFYVVGAK